MDGFERIHKEKTMLSRLKHENILSVLDVIVEVDRSVILVEYADHGSVYHLLHNEEKKVEDMRKMKWVVQCANVSFIAYQLPFPKYEYIAIPFKGLAFLHEENVLHCDLKTKNLMITDKFNLKICDFGLVNNFETTNAPSIDTNGYMAPEVCISKKLYDSILIFICVRSV